MLLSANELDQAVAFLKDGELVAVPTETVYGLAAPLFNEAAIKKIFQVKQRPIDNPLIVHCANVQQAEQLLKHPTPLFYQLAEAFWPGPLTMVLEKQERVPSIVSAGLDTVAVRIPQHPLTLELIEKLGEPIVAPSANISGYPSPTCAAHVLADLNGKISAVLDGGQCQLGIESTVVYLESHPPQILRPGSITAADLRAAGEVEFVEQQNLREGEAVRSPGVKYRHYAPQARVRAVDSWDMVQKIVNEEEQKQRKILVSEAQNREAMQQEFLEATIKPLAAKTLYTEFREADQLGIKEIIIICDATVKNNKGLYNRISKAAE